MINYFVLDNQCSRDYGLYISGSGVFNAPERDVETISIPGRDGDLIKDNNRYKNIQLTYPAFVRREFLPRVDAIKMWLMQDAGYQRLEDTYNPDYYRMARFAGPLNFDMRALNRAGETSITFDCKPQRWRKDGQDPIVITGGAGTIYNDLLPSRPLIRINGTTTDQVVVYVGKYPVIIKEMTGHITIDSDTQNAYRNTVNQNQNVSIADFPVLQHGTTKIRWTSDAITSVEIIPRWWTI